MVIYYSVRNHPKAKWPMMTNIYYLIVLVGQESGWDLVGDMAQDPYLVTLKLLTSFAVI